MRFSLTQLIQCLSQLIIVMGLVYSSSTLASGEPRFSAGVIGSVGQGPMGNGADVPTRMMLFTSASVFTGFNYKKIRLGANYEYYRAGQTSDSSDVAGQNISGSGQTPGVRLDYYDGVQSFGVIYRLYDTYILERPTIQGLDVKYKAKSGFTVQYYRQFKKRFGFVIDFTSEEFDDSLTNKIKWNRIGLGLVFTNFTK
ncbi:MAG: hypothetical protein H7061_08355 [Bdellovibrionaceae bacterium]|nr:hypothetical protein [Bdellovibrio sp.]